MPANELQGETLKDEMREAFEAWYAENESNLEGVFDQTEAGSYRGTKVQIAWDAWQAACSHQREQDALICERHLRRLTPVPAIDAHNEACEHCASAIRSGGSHDRA